MTVLSVDTFVRANAATWGTASGGEGWNEPAGVAVQAIVSNQGRLGPGGQDSQLVLGTQTASTINITCRVKAGDAGNVAAVLFRYSTGNGYRAGIYGSNLILDKYVSGSRLNVSSVAIGANVGDEWWITAVAVGSSIQIFAWKDGSSQPGTPQINVTDTSNINGQYGVSVFLNTDYCYFDSLTVTDNQAAPHAMNLTGSVLFKVRARQAIESRAGFQIRAKNASVGRSRFVVRASQVTQGRSRFLIPIHALLVPLRLAFAVQQLLGTSFVVVQHRNLTFNQRISMAQPLSTITSTCTATDASGAAIPSAASVAVVVTFPDGSTSSYSLASGVTNVGNGAYMITYQTKGPGLIREDWHMVDDDGVTAVDAANYVPVSY